MPIVAYGYALDVFPDGGDNLVLALVADPDIMLESDVSITADPSPIVVEVESDIEVEVE